MKTLVSKRWLILFSLLLLSSPLGRAQSAGPGNALNLDGASGYAQAANGVYFNGNFTIEAWVFVRSYNNWSRLIDFANGPDNNNVLFALSAGNSGVPLLGVYTSGGPQIQANTQLPTNQWVHLAATLNGTTGTIYFNGNPVGSGPLNVPPNVIRTINYIGRSNYGGDGYANALFDEIRIWNVAKSQTQIQANMHRSLAGSEAGLVSYWRADEATGAVLTDSSGHGQTATLFGGTSWTNSTVQLITGAGSALNFNAVAGQSVNIPHQVALNAYPLTVMTWFMVPTNSNGGALVNKYVSSSKNGYQIFIAGNLRAWYFRDSLNNVFNNGVMDAGPVNDGLWHHAAMTIDASGGRLYLDGVLKSNVTWSGTAGAPTTTQPVSLGLYPGDSFFTGRIDDVSIWNTSLSGAQIQAAMNHPLSGAESGLIGYWRLDEGSGTNTVDSSGHGNNGTLQGNPTWISSGATEVGPDPGYALDLNGTDSYVQVTNGVWFTNDFTVEGWVFCRSYNNWSRLFDFGNAGYLQEVYMALSEGTTGFPKMGIFTNGNNNLVGSSQQLPLNQWTHLATTLSGSTATIYMNGNAVGSGTVLVPGNFVRTNNYIGRSLFGGDAYANAAFDEIRIWNVARSASQIQQKMNSPLTGSETNLIGYWRFDEGNGTNTIDATGNGNNAVLNGTASKPTWLFSRAPVTNSATMQLITLPATGLTITSATLNGLVNPLGRAAGGWFQEGATTNYGVNTPLVAMGNGSTNVSTSFVLTNLTPGTTYHYRVAATNVAGTNFGLDVSFTTQGGPPVVTTLSVSNIGPTSATLAASVNPGGAATTVYFLYGPTTSYGATNIAGSVGSGVSPVIISSTLSNLVPATTYHFLVVASNSVAVTSGTDSTFQTPAGAPLVSAPSITNLTANSVTLSASVNPGGAATTVYFLYGTTTNYGATDVVPNIGGGSTPLIISDNISNLAANTVYHFLVTASNNLGIASTTDSTFQTYGPPTVTTLPASGVRATRAILNGTVNPNGFDTAVYFQYGPTLAFGSATLLTNLTAGTNPVAVSYSVGLAPTTTYYYRVVGSNSVGSVNGLALSFDTLAYSATNVVTTLNDGGPGSLRQAILDANAAAGNAIIDASGLSGVIGLTNSLPILTNGMTIQGSGPGTLRISGSNLFRIFFVDTPGDSVIVSNFTIANGMARGGTGGNHGGGGAGMGGGMFVNAGDVTVENVIFSGNSAAGGTGGIAGATPHGGGGGGGGLGGNGGAGDDPGGTTASGGGGGGGYAGNGGRAGDDSAGGGGGISGNGGDGGVIGGGGGGGTIDGATGGNPNGGAGGGGGGNGGGYRQNGNPGSYGGGGGGGGYGYLVGGRIGGAGGKFGGGGGGTQDSNGGCGPGGGAGGDFGGGGGASGVNCITPGGAGGFGGGGGGGGLYGSRGGNGGFGGGGGGGAYNLARGFGGPFGGTGGNIAFGGAGGGGGGALGGSVFVRANNGASLTFLNSSTDAGSLTPGVGGAGGTLDHSQNDHYPTGGGATGSSFFLLGGVNVFTVTQGTNVVAGDIGGWGGAPPTVLKNGAGTLVLSANSGYPGTTFVNGGTLEIDGGLPGTDLTLNSGGILSGTGSVATVTCTAGGTFSPGVMIGILNTASSVWSGAGNYNWQIYDALGAAGVGVDLLNINGTLDLSNARGFNINLATLSSISPPLNGPALNFSSVGTSNSWVLVQTTDGIIGFNSTNFNLNLGPTNGTGGFFNSLVGGELTLSVDGNNLILTYTHFAPGVATAFATAITPASVTLNGQVNPNGTASAGWFQYGLTTNYGSTTTRIPMGSGSVALPLSQNIGVLPSGALYHFRAAGSNSFGTVFGDDFELGIPQAVTQPATGILAGRAILNGTVNPGGLPTTVYFQYGPTTNYGTTTATTNLAAGNLSQALSIPLSSLSPATTYYYRVVAVNSFGQVTGSSQSFTTAPLASTYVVSTLNDNGPGSLRQAILSANAALGEGLVDVTVTGVIALASSLPIVTNSMTIQGSGATNLSISGNNQVRIFFVDVPHGELSINNITLQNGRARGGTGGNRGGGGAGMGGGLFVNAGDVTISGVAFSGNAAAGGNGGIAGGDVSGGGGGGLGGNGGNGGDSSGNPAGGGGGGYGGNGGDGLEGAGGGGGVAGTGGNGSSNGGGGGGGGTVAGADAIGGTGGLGGGGGGNGGSQSQNGQPGGFYGGGGGGGGSLDTGGSSSANGGAGGAYGGGGGGSSLQSGSQDFGYGAGRGGDFGGGGGSPGLSGPNPIAGAGGFGGGGGGGGTADSFSMYVPGGAGGFGGGSGGSGTFTVPTGPFGGQGGHIIGGGGGGGGGAALGGAIFVRATNGASLTFVDISADAGSLTAGAGGTGLPVNPANGDQASQAGQTAGSAMFLFGGDYIFTVNQPRCTIAGDISGWSGAPVTLNKNGSGTLVLSAYNSYPAPTLVSAGTLQVDGAISGSVTVNSAATLSGLGTVGGTTLNAGATISPGLSLGIGVINALSNVVWVGAGNYNWDLYDALAAPGTGGDLLHINGVLDLSNASGFNINVASSPVGRPPSNFSNPVSYSWTLVQTTDGILGFNPTNFIINLNPTNGTAGFVNPYGTGSFTLSVVGNNLVLTFQPSPPSVTTLAADQLGNTTSTLHATVNPNGTPTLAWFQYGLDTNYGTFTATNALGASTNSVALGQAISGLQPGTLYHFRAVATNGIGLTAGSDVTFTLTSSTPPILTGATMLPNGAFQFSFTNQGASFIVLSATNISLPLSDWTVMGVPSNVAPGVFQFTTPLATNDAQRFFRVRSP